MRSLTLAALALLTAAACSPAPKGGPGTEAGAAPDFPGSYAQSCRDITTLKDGFITAACSNGAGEWTETTLKAAACQGDIGNQLGVLTCNGAAATPGSEIPPQAEVTPAPSPATTAPGAYPSDTGALRAR